MMRSGFSCQEMKCLLTLFHPLFPSQVSLKLVKKKKGDRSGGGLVVIFYLDRKSHLLPSNSELHKALGNDIY